jgi:ubiquinone biosynthesis protein
LIRGLRAGRNLRRLCQIVLILARYDALFPLRGLPGLTWLISFLRLWRRRGAVAAALTALGPTFIKLGQTLSLRADLVGDTVAEDLALLQDRLPPFAGVAARQMIELEFGRPLDQLYRSFHDTAVAAASIAQVHFAVSSEGEEVAVKVLRPGIEAAFARDLDLFLWLARLVERFNPAARRLKPRAVVETLAQSVRLEMDLRFEAAAASELRQNFTGDASFRVPPIDWQRTSARVLTLARVSGIRVDDRAALTDAGHDVHAIMAKAASAFFNQVFRDGFFHADMHPGNLFIASDGAIVPVDFGIMGRLDRKTRYYLADMLVAFLTGDYRRVAEVHFEAGYVPATQSREWFAQACRAIGEPILDRPLHEISLGRLLAQLFKVTKQFDMETQPQLLLLQKTMMLAEGVGRMLDPAVNMWLLARPLIEEWMRENRGPEAHLKQVGEDAFAFFARLPTLIDHIERAAKRAALPPQRRRRLPATIVLPLWIAAGALAVIAIRFW